MIQVAVANHSSDLTDYEVDLICVALGVQATHHIGPAWNRCPVHVQRMVPANSSAWLLGFFDDSDQAGALGYHDDTGPGGLPAMKVFVKSCRENGISESACASHELGEALVDPFLTTANFDGRSKFWATEIGDPVQASIYEVDGIEVQNFVRPAWFTAGAVADLDHMGVLTHAFEVPSGGYGQFLDIRHPGLGWQQLGAELGAGHSRPTRRRASA